jgi:TolA-binding protein
MTARLLLLVLLFIDLPVFSQQTAIYFDPEYCYQTGLDLIEKQKYGAAQKEFLKIIASTGNVSITTRGNSAYYSAKCAAELFNKDAEYLLLKFLNEYPENQKYQDAVFELGNYYYRQKQYKKAIEWLAKVDQSTLESDKKDEINFKLGYSYYMANDYDNAGHAFFAMKDGNSKYATAAQYYYAHISYMNENYETALNSFLKLKDSESFAPVVPYYITQIYYKQGKYDELLKYAPSVLDSSATRNGLEISRMVAESHYRKENYKEALQYLLDYEKNSPASGRTDQYAIAFSYYRTGEFEKAASYFQKVIGGDDSLTQNAYYHLADCFLHTSNKRSARNAFQSAAKTSFNPSIQEESHFNFARLSYELNFQSAAIESFVDFKKKFPKSVYADKANEMMIDIYANTRNYKDAITALNAIENKSHKMKSAYQRVTYFRGVELFMDNKPDEAVKLFTQSLTCPIDQSLVANANYWSGESFYKLNNYEEAIRTYSEFLVTPAALKNKNYNTANYNIGYALFKNEKYFDAQMAFRKYVTDKHLMDATRYNDALLRIGDCFFMLKDQASAMDFYNQAIAASAKAGDYALYQKAMIQGVQGRMNDKVASLQKLMDKYPKSVYFDDALYEAGNASLIAGNNEQALSYFRKVISDYPSGMFSRKAELGEALVFYNTKQDERALTAYKKIVQKYPNTDESRQALIQIKNISVSQNKVDDYMSYVRTIPEANITGAEEDSLMYDAAELQYTQGNCESAVKDFSRYLEKFPDAIFKVSANYLKSDCHFRNKQYAEALPGYEYVISQPAGNFTEKSLLHAGLINYNLKQYDKALNAFEKLEGFAKSKDNILASLAGQLRSTYVLGDCDKAQIVSRKIFNSQVTDKDLVNEARLISGKCYFNNEKYAEAKADLQIVAKQTNSEMTAESRYLLAVIEYRLNNFKESQKLIFEIQKQVPSYDYWVAKGFLLLGDNYIAQKDTFQAKETYKSIVENFEYQPTYPEDLRDIAREKLAAIAVEEEERKANEQNQKEMILPKDSMEIEPGKK